MEVEHKIGTEQAEAVFRRYADMIYRIALHDLKDPADAEDILQEVCLVLMTKRVPDDEEHLKRWLIRVTINKCRDLSRSFWRRNRESIDDYEHLEADKPPEIIEELRQLPENYRNIIYLYYYEEYTVSEIADILKMNVNTVKSGLRRARERLKSYLTDTQVRKGDGNDQ